MTFKNLSRSESFGISTEFGIDYHHQSISLLEVPDKIKAAIKKSIQSSEDAKELIDVIVELKQAGASSLDYLVFLKMRSGAAASYLKLERQLQQICVAVCTAEGWGIPFPHMTLKRHSEK